MRLSVLALDYDGTVAGNDVLDVPVRQAIAAVRHSGIVVLLVTGRMLGELRRVAGDLHFVDASVAENGAVVHFPDSGYASAVAAPVPAHFVVELGRRRVPRASRRVSGGCGCHRRRAAARGDPRAGAAAGAAVASDVARPLTGPLGAEVAHSLPNGLETAKKHGMFRSAADFFPGRQYGSACDSDCG